MPVRDQSWRERRSIDLGGPSRTQQHHAERVNINTIVAKYRKTGALSHLAPRTPLYGDFNPRLTLQEAFDQVEAANEEFRRLPAALRRRCGEHPVGLLRMLETVEGCRELHELGLPFDRELPEPEATGDESRGPEAPSEGAGEAVPS